MDDIVIRAGQVIDGTGAPACVAYVAIRAGLLVRDKTRTTPKHDHIERLWRSQRRESPSP